MTASSARPLVIVNAAVFTADPMKPSAQAVAVTGEVISSVGTNEEVRSSHRNADVLDAGGRTLLPGFIDAHNHFLATGESLASLDVRYPAVKTIADLVAAVARAAEDKAPGEVVHAYGYDDAKYERPPTRADLDSAAPKNPVLVGHVSGHSVLASSLAIERSGVREDAADPPGGALDRDARGRLTGVFRDAAMGLVQPTVVDVGHHGPNFHVRADPAELVSAVETAGLAFVTAGLTTVCDAQVTSRELRAYRDAREAGRLHVRTVCMPLSSQLEEYESLGLAGPFGDDWLAIGPMKFYCDGSLIGGTAAFSTPYGVHDELGGLLYWDPEELAAAIARAHRDGWQIGVHAQGDRAIGIVLDAFEHAERAHPMGDPRFRIEHAGFPTEAQLRRMAEPGVIMVVQPSYLRDSGDDFLERLPGRAHRLQPLRSALDHGVRVVLSSDSDVASYRPLDTIAAAVERATLSGADIGKAEALTVTEAVQSHTIWAAHAIRAERQRGSIEAGKLADLVAVGGAIFDCPPEEIRDLPIEMTVIGGRIAHCSF
jgi:predicted amidohydrolase YtcJ